MVPLSWYLIFAAALFSIGLFGVLSRRNAVAILLGIELMLNAVNINLAAFWRYGDVMHMAGQVFAIIVFAVAAAEVAVGLALVISVYRRRNTVMADEIDYDEVVGKIHMTTETLIWLIPLPPVLAFFLIVLFTNRSKALSHTIAVGAAFLSWLGSMIVFVRALGVEHLGEHPFESSINWLPTGDTWLKIGVLVDPLTAVTLFFVAWTVLMIFLYSVGYHNYGQPKGDHDQRVCRLTARPWKNMDTSMLCHPLSRCTRASLHLLVCSHLACTCWCCPITC